MEYAEHLGFWSILPILLAIACAVVTRKVILALFLGVYVGVLTLERGNPIAATTSMIRDYLVVQLTDSYNAGVLVLLAFIGGFVALMERSGGAAAFARKASHLVSNGVRMQLAAWFGGVVIFFSDLGTPLIVGPIFEPLADRWKVSREKLAWILDSTASPVAVLVPITGWAVYIMGLIQKEYEALGVSESDWTAFVEAIPFNFYSIVTVVLVPVVALAKIDLGAMRRAEERTREGELYWPHSKPLRPPADVTDTEGSAALVWVPLLVLFVTFFGLLAPHGFPLEQVSGSVFRTALTAGYFFGGVSLLVLMSRTRSQSFFDSDAFDLYTEGIQKMMTVAAILILAWSLGAVGRELGTARYIIEIGQAGVPPVLVPALVFVVGAVMSFATGSSWGSFAILLPLVIPLAHSLDLALPLSIGAVLAGGLFGDHASPISDTTILSSTGAGADHIDHVKTQLPYALIAAAASVVSYVVAGATESPWSLVLATVLAVTCVAWLGRRK
ncbi:MAG: Na+/H+ antiporter NhaC family protein [Acidobacteriota bacterium]|nr:MAG: Na+/H+ antiporter NhaC family protein [Acidobacteriota bacterium]